MVQNPQRNSRKQIHCQRKTNELKDLRIQSLELLSHLQSTVCLERELVHICGERLDVVSQICNNLPFMISIPNGL